METRSSDSSWDNLRNKHRLVIENDPREKASCDSLLPKVIALEEILRGIGFSSGVHTSSTLCRKDFDANLSSFLPIYKKNERLINAIFEFLKKPLEKSKVDVGEKDCKKQICDFK
ncbi:9116_t:CDS:2 [Paraglomus brasilianum]|uniref:9116_t:CDS:1 n=1 Tax=Paraglomus brasilianum TaxID=144538 RepID=A0A9N9FJ02_9GLOM|nr:9116_t:CDS:2 [Paraglomus brasilianum]